MVKPILKALLLADQVYQDKTTGKIVIAGTFNRIWAARFPCLFARQPCVYVCLTEAKGQFAVQLRYVELATHEVVGEMEERAIKVNDPLLNIELIFHIPPILHKSQGLYAFEVYADDELLGMTRVFVAEQGQEKG